MSPTLEAQQETAERLFYAAVGAPVVVGKKAREFGKAVFAETTVDDLVAAGREFASHLQDSKVVEQIQDTMDVELFQQKVDMLRDQLETLLVSWRDQFDVRRESVKIEVDVESDGPKKAATKGTTAAKKTTAAAKQATSKK